jgi:hypothetical protein
MNRVWTRLGAIIFSLIVPGGCALYEPHISDLALVSVEIVPPRVLESTGALRDREPQVKITFSSSANLVDIPQGGHFFWFLVYPKITICKNENIYDDREINFESAVFWQRGDVNGPNTYFDDDYSIDMLRKLYPAFRSQELKYYAVFAPIRHVLGVPHPIEFAFDLERQPEDLCFAVYGGDMLGATYQSNTVVVPKAAIAEAFREAAARGR